MRVLVAEGHNEKRGKRETVVVKEKLRGGRLMFC
jgi:hypothetical protein